MAKSNDNDWAIGDDVEVKTMKRLADMSLEETWKPGIVMRADDTGIEVHFGDGRVRTFVEHEGLVRKPEAAAKAARKAADEPKK
jgi:hypothetical protein